jgi:uncharacterized surface protein with fasciclin (FAS1) repeats
VSDGSLDVSFGSEDGIVTTDRQLVIRGISDLGDAETRIGGRRALRDGSHRKEYGMEGTCLGGHPAEHGRVTGRRGPALLALIASITLVACGNENEPGRHPEGSIAAVLAGDDRFDTLMRILEQDAPEIVLRSLSDTDVDITWFAPTDEAFAALPEGVLDALLSDDRSLQAVLDHHAIRGAYSSAELKARAREDGRLGTIAGALIELSLYDGVLMVDEATVIEVDNEAVNGVIHVLDGVLIPEFVYLFGPLSPTRQG